MLRKVFRSVDSQTVQGPGHGNHKETEQQKRLKNHRNDRYSKCKNCDQQEQLRRSQGRNPLNCRSDPCRRTGRQFRRSDHQQEYDRRGQQHKRKADRIGKRKRRSAGSRIQALLQKRPERDHEKTAADAGGDQPQQAKRMQKKRSQRYRGSRTIYRKRKEQRNADRAERHKSKFDRVAGQPSAKITAQSHSDCRSQLQCGDLKLPAELRKRIFGKHHKNRLNRNANADKERIAKCGKENRKSSGQCAPPQFQTLERTGLLFADMPLFVFRRRSNPECGHNAKQGAQHQKYSGNIQFIRGGKPISGKPGGNRRCKGFDQRSRSDPGNRRDERRHSNIAVCFRQLLFCECLRQDRLKRRTEKRRLCGHQEHHSQKRNRSPERSPSKTERAQSHYQQFHEFGEDQHIAFLKAVRHGSGGRRHQQKRQDISNRHCKHERRVAEISGL